LSSADWQRLNFMWIIYFAFAGTANIFVAYTFSEAVWVNFKLFGLLAMTVVFVVFQTAWLSRHGTETDDGDD
jgi:intracellular septation protein